MEANIKTVGIDAIYFPVKDVQRSIAFYRDTVGVEPSGVSEEWGAEYDLPEGAGWGFGPAHLFGGNTNPATVYFAIPDVRAAAERLRAKGGYEVGEIMESPVCTMAFVNDGEGNALLPSSTQFERILDRTGIQTLRYERCPTCGPVWHTAAEN